AGLNPYANDFRPEVTNSEFHERYGHMPADQLEKITTVTTLAGRIVLMRQMGKATFVTLRDASGADLQAFFKSDRLGAKAYEQIKLFDLGDIIGVAGTPMRTKTGELTIAADGVRVLTKALRPLPDKGGHGFRDVEQRYRQRYVDLAVSPDVREVFRKRSAIVRGIRRFLDARQFLEVETPMMHPIIGGAAARPFITHHNTLDMKLYMRIAPELYLKRLVVGGFERVYEINRNFRNEGLSRQHNPEFTMLEFYQAYATYTDLMDLTEQMVGELALEVNGSTKTTWDGIEVELAAPWRRLSIQDAVRDLGNVAESARVFADPAFAAETAIGLGISPGEVARALLEGVPPGALGMPADEIVAGFKDPGHRPTLAAQMIERYPNEVEARVRAGHIGYLVFEATAEAKLVQPTFLTQFPLAVSPLARKNDKDPAFCDRFELFVCGKEIANGFSELNDPDDQRSRFLAQLVAKATGAAETMDYDEDYCRALEIGMPPAAGEGIGIDRLTMMLTGQASIRDVILFPLMRPE
ncbi:MAG TPA: lysine--tRNA ligase, partial [Kofleriaceae bacterium]|nr:lysine--tRNA ligase [Kofleriaceae bacterium]